MSSQKFVPNSDAHLEFTLNLNNQYAPELSLLDRDQLVALPATAYHARITPDQNAFLIALNQDAAYKSSNFLWFKEPWDRFIYVDRLAIAAKARGRGLAQALYADLLVNAIRDSYEIGKTVRI